MQGRGSPRYVSTQERREAGGGRFVGARKRRERKQVCECTEGEGGGKDAQRERNRNIWMSRREEVGGRCWFAEKGDRERRGERCVYTCE